MPYIHSIPIHEPPLLFVDTELTGFELDKEICEIGYIKADGKSFALLDEGVIKLIPAHIERANAESLSINGYNTEEWEREGVDQASGLERFARISEGALLVGHNIAFDWMHLVSSFETYGIVPKFYYKSLDTFSMAWQKLRGKAKLEKFSLEELANYFNVDRGRAHRALDDARTTFEVFKKLITL